MKDLRFYTNINCSNCVRAVTPTLDELAGAGNWHVDTTLPEKVLTVQADTVSPQRIMEAVQEAGFEIQPA
jgi:copper chaperone CopZ